jgi:putative ATP-binding cassette transporter
VLARVRLCSLQQRCGSLDSEVDWATLLSHGEQQKIAFARLLLAQPRLALLDESTNAMDEENEVISGNTR